MIKLTIVEPTTKEWKRWRRDCDLETAALKESVKAGNAPKITRLYARKNIKKEFFFARRAYFNGKCAYCECYITDFQHGDVEHFRPKSSVTDEHDQPVMISDEHGQLVYHPGYYWLAYDWQNLLPSCTCCNQATDINGKKVGKHSRFPVAGSHATSPEQSSQESPLLINPTVDDPGEHLTINVGDGILSGLTDRGEMSIKVLGLNHRAQLPEERGKVALATKALITELINDPDSREKNLRVLAEYVAGRRSYAMAAKAQLRASLPGVYCEA